MRALRWDIFCTVVDNYGDIGVCWRLARQLAAEFGQTVRLWVDDLHSFRCIQPEIDPALAQQRCAGVTVCRWDADFPAVEPAQVVVEAFACELPACYVAAMRAAPPVWVNLEYLSAEDWVEGCHGLVSPQGGLGKYFFFPGFTSQTGGVLGEAAMRAERALWQPAQAQDWLGRWLPPQADALRLSLFAYENPAVAELLAAWCAGGQPLQVFLPEGRLLPQVRAALDAPTLRAGEVVRRGALTLACLPMLPQSDYDRLLWSCDLNFVRGEDSFVRAQWAAQPFVWHIYPQDDEVHHDKLEAFLARYTAGQLTEPAEALAEFWRAWNKGAGAAEAWPELLRTLPALRQHAGEWAKHLMVNGDLATNLVKFVLGKVE